jgi:thioredoxin reductase (NADPH)
MYDVIIIGMGISGITAGIYLKRANKDIMMFDGKMPGGLLNEISSISNYPGYINISGSELAENLFNQINVLNIPYKLESIKDVRKVDDYFEAETSNGVYKAKNVIIACGRTPRKLGLPNEDKLLGHGISTCALCDGFFYRGKDIAVVGSGDSALQEALYLSNIVNKIYLIVRKNKMRASLSLQEAIKNKENVEIVYESTIKEINEINGQVDSIVLNTDRLIDVNGIFIYIGFVPNNDIIKKFDILDENGYVKNIITDVKGLYAVGDIVKKDVNQLVVAANDGVLVANHIIND